MKPFLKIAFVILVLTMSWPVFAQQPEKLVQIRLVPERETIKAGETILIGIEQSIKPGWHTYWKNPGDSGTAPRVKWTLPDGFVMGEIRWPQPPHKIATGPLTNYGYENSVIMLQQLKAPASLPEGPLTLKADIEILVCQEECIPEYGTYQLTLNAAETAAQTNSAYFKTIAFKPMSVSGATFREKAGNFVVEMPVTWDQSVAKYDFIPEDWGLVANSAPVDIFVKDGTLTIIQKRGDRPLETLKEIKGLLVWAKNESYEFTAMAKASPPLKEEPGEASSAPKHPQQDTFPSTLLLAFLGGLILNLMPCVFPVLSIKALSLVKNSGKDSRAARLHGLAYTAGIMLSFLAIAAALIAFRRAGAEIGWGFQLQNPIVVTLLAYLLFIIGLNLSGLFEIGGGFGNIGNKFTQGAGLKNSFFTGVLATLVATPCTAPFMAAAIGAALLLSPPAALAVFATLGFGLAFPYLALSFVPALQKIMPRPGAWMETFRQLLAFPMFASSAWLVWVLSQQAGPMGVFGALMGLVFIAFGFWLLKHRPRNRYWNYKVKLLALASFTIAICLLPAGQMAMPDKTPHPGAFGQPFSESKLEELLKTGDPVFVEMTAAWCITCKVNHAVALNIDSTKKVFADNHVQYLIGDWTNQDAEITKYLNAFGRNGVPIYVYYAPPGAGGQRPDPEVLPQLLTPGMVKNVIERKN